MADKNVQEATRNLTTAVQEANQAIVTSAVETQQRELKFAQSMLENGIEVLKNSAEDTRHLIRIREPRYNFEQAFVARCAASKLSVRSRIRMIRKCQNSEHDRESSLTVGKPLPK